MVSLSTELAFICPSSHSIITFHTQRSMEDTGEIQTFTEFALYLCTSMYLFPPQLMQIHSTIFFFHLLSQAKQAYEKSASASHVESAM